MLADGNNSFSYRQLVNMGGIRAIGRTENTRYGEGLIRNRFRYDKLAHVEL